jgi:hypothetical protein
MPELTSLHERLATLEGDRLRQEIAVDGARLVEAEYRRV